MTVVVGLKFGQDMVLAADKEENDTYLRYQIQKIQRLGFPNGMIAGIAGDGDAHFIDYSAGKLKDYLLNHPKISVLRMGQGIEKVLKEVFAEHIFATNLEAKERPDFGLLVACSRNGQSKMFKTKQAAPVNNHGNNRSNLWRRLAEQGVDGLGGVELTVYGTVLHVPHP